MPRKARLYIDANATVPPLAEVAQAATEAMASAWGNPSSQHTEGRAARRLVQTARADIAALLGVPETWLTFTSGGTEAINMWLHGLRTAITPARRVVLTTSGEHPAVRMPLAHLAETGTIDVELVPTDRLGRIASSDLEAAIARIGAPRVLTAMLIAAHNETGGMQDLAALTAICKSHGVLAFFDGVQWTGKAPIDIGNLGIDGWPVSFHKFGGPKGIGVLAARPGVLQSPLIAGGPQEKRRRGGTENVPGIAGAGIAAKLALSLLDERRARWRQTLNDLRAGLRLVWPDVEFVHDELGLPQTLLTRFPGWKGTEMAQRLDLEGIAVSTGSACASGAQRASEALLRMGITEAEAEELVRFSLPPHYSDDLVAEVCRTLSDIRN